ncbi:hypothetical protein EVAR_88489_1 [Eumeta japonica]|uniref:Uncharacterized protein n=1 Tax=Eumeta variegata TaxID=151549 RepID=A0A4C1XVU6_EUMVA|nr:hypothetical protein EVAR_88489_1 [Eumeta japonica]
MSGTLRAGQGEPGAGGAGGVFPARGGAAEVVNRFNDPDLGVATLANRIVCVARALIYVITTNIVRRPDGALLAKT